MKKKSKRGVLVVSLLNITIIFSNLILHNQCFAQLPVSEIDSVRIQYLDFREVSPWALAPEDFSTKRVIIDTTFYRGKEGFYDLTDKLICFKEAKKGVVDTRVLISFYSDDNIVVYGMSKFGDFTREGIIYKNRRLKKVLLRLYKKGI